MKTLNVCTPLPILSRLATICATIRKIHTKYNSTGNLKTRKEQNELQSSRDVAVKDERSPLKGTISENHSLKAEVQDLERKLDVDYAAMIKEQFAGMKEQLLGQTMDIQFHYVSVNNDCLQLRDEISIYEGAKRQLEHEI
ncbi:hypothetical protein L798_00387 [Zootermopsis nevadensis]|uniref:Uncharacterized protein n=1 Tax=Zootermopsis nevadensis TaxID=136037 RepID=A0A067RMP6_ZOONE|nr:hypothetical protein L798_00387 [Zootermopsis nevadensis]